jgi:phosphodiesterase/alkaline phosphatase D-like protein
MKRWFGVLALFLLASGSIATDAHAQQAWNSVTLSWTTPGDDSLSGNASQFDIRYSTSQITAANFSAATRWTTGVPTPTTSGTTQSVMVTGLTPATTYWFAIKTADEVPNWAGLSNVVSRATTTAPDVIRPAPIAMTITAQTDSTVTVQWTAVGDDSLTGTATSYDLRMSTSAITAANFGAATALTGEPAPAAPGTVQTFTVRNLSRQATYWFAIKATDDAANVSAISNVPSVTTPDTTPPSAITNLTLGLVWMNFSSAAVTPSRRWHGR